MHLPTLFFVTAPTPPTHFLAQASSSKRFALLTSHDLLGLQVLSALHDATRAGLV